MNWNQFADFLAADILKQEDRMEMSMLGLAFGDRNVIAVVRLRNGRSIKVYECGRFYFVYQNTVKKVMLDTCEVDDLFSGVEYFMAILESQDAEILWNWFVNYGK